MKIILTDVEVNQIKKEMKVNSIRDIELAIMKCIPVRYQKIIQFKESTSGALGINIPETYSMMLLKILNPNSSSSMHHVINELKNSKSKIMISNPKLVLALMNLEKETSKIAKS